MANARGNWWEGVVWAQTDDATMYHKDDGPLPGPFPDEQLQVITKMLLWNLASFRDLPSEMRALRMIMVVAPDEDDDEPGVCLEDLEGIDRFPALRQLEVDGHGLTSIEPLRAMKSSLAGLCIRYNEIRDISPLENHTRLERLLLSGNPVTDLGVLEGFSKLRSLSLRETALRDLDQIVNLESLENLDLPSRMNEEQVAAFKAQRPEVSIRY